MQNYAFQRLRMYYQRKFLWKFTDLSESEITGETFVIAISCSASSFFFSLPFLRWISLSPSRYPFTCFGINKGSWAEFLFSLELASLNSELESSEGESALERRPEAQHLAVEVVGVQVSRRQPCRWHGRWTAESQARQLRDPSKKKQSQY